MTVDTHPGWYTVHYWKDDALQHRKFDTYADAVVFDQHENGDNATLPPVVGGLCAVCGESDFLIAQDETRYSSLDWCEALQRFEFASTSIEVDDTKGPRMYCCQCGTYHQLPEYLL